VIKLNEATCLAENFLCFPNSLQSSVLTNAKAEEGKVVSDISTSRWFKLHFCLLF
jgi:hypothetical protein